MPPELFETGKVKMMSDSDIRFYNYLCWMSDRHSSREFKVVAKEAATRTGMSIRSISTARRHLCQLGLVCCKAIPGGAVTYTLCDVRTGKPYPGNPREKIISSQKTKVSAPAKASEVKAQWQPRVLTVEADDDPNTSFDFGHNAIGHEQTLAASDFNPFRSDFNPY